MNADVRRELEGLLSALCDGVLTDAEHARLEELLADEECRRTYLEYIDMHARLIVHPGLGDALPAPVAAEAAPALDGVRRRSTFAHVLRYAAVAVSTLAASLLVQLCWWHPAEVADRSADPLLAPVKLPAPAAEPIATLMQTADCAWRGAHESLRDGTRLKPGSLELHKGLARIRFDSGSELLVQGPAELHLDARDAATLLRGKLVFRNDVMAGPFDLHTPAATLVDLGSEYGVTVGADGEEVHVFEGDVQRVSHTVAAEADPQYLQAGEACRCGPASFASRPARYDPSLFVRHLAEPAVPDAMAGLLAYEGFDYKSANALTTGKANGGRGWTGVWTVTAARPLAWGEQKRLPLNVEESLTRPGAAVPAVGGRFDHAGFGVYYRRLTTPLRLDTDGVYYLSCLFRRDGPSGHPFNTVALILRPNESHPASGRVRDGHKGKHADREHRHHEYEHAHDHAHEREHEHAHDPRPSLANRLMIGAGGSNQLFTRVGMHCARASLPISSNVTYLLVAKIVASQASYDQVFVRVYGPREPIGAEEPQSWTVTGPALHSDLALHWLGVHVNSKNRQMIDEIRFGATWPSVTGPWRRRPAAAGAAKDGNT